MELDDFDKILAAAKMPEKDIPLCLRGDLQAEWERLDAELKSAEEMAKQQSTPTLAGGESAPAVMESAAVVMVAARVRELESAMADAMVTLKLRAMNRAAWFDLTAKHPPREDVVTDRVQGFNGASIWDDLIAETLVEPKLDRERVTKLLDSITPGQLDRLANEAWALNRRDTVSVPFSLTASRIALSSDVTSKPPPDSGSPTSGGRGGNRKKSPGTSTTSKDA